jgi:hypothetical protein
MRNKNVLILTLVIIFLSIGIGYTLDVNSRQLDEHVRQMLILEKTIDSLRIENHKLNSTVIRLYEQNDSLDVLISDLNFDIIQIKEDAKNRIINVDTLNHQHLLQFFSDRYN